VFTRWGALVILEPSRRHATFGNSLKRCVVVFLVSGLAWFLFQFFTNGGLHSF
jgi:membrane associated rhomboid family serine protease